MSEKKRIVYDDEDNAPMTDDEVKEYKTLAEMEAAWNRGKNEQQEQGV